MATKAFDRTLELSLGMQSDRCCLHFLVLLHEFVLGTPFLAHRLFVLRFEFSEMSEIDSIPLHLLLPFLEGRFRPREVIELLPN
jgi:hypothetical protein